MNEPRPYHNEPDLEAMANLLMAGRKANNGSYYIHIGDLNWWLYLPTVSGRLLESHPSVGRPCATWKAIGLGTDLARLGGD